MADMLVTLRSTLPGAGEGIFARTFIPKHTLIPITHGAPEAADPSIPDSDVEDILEFSVNRDEIDQTSLCVSDGAIVTLADVKIHPSALEPRIVRAPRCQPCMKGNDLAWDENDVRSEETYLLRAKMLNKMELVLVFDQGRVCGVRGLFTESACGGEEVGITYGYSYWKAPLRPEVGAEAGHNFEPR